MFVSKSSKRKLTHVVLFFFLLELAFSILIIVPSAEAAVTKGKKTFKVSAYYSPLPNQENYLRGNYEAEVKLNGRGISGASGVGVHPGMIAAPKTYPFGTKIKLDGLGIGTVEDRGGAIVSAGSGGQSYDRLDVWMGYGDEGLKRALRWGMRVVEGEILGETSDLDTIDFEGLRGGEVVHAKKEEPALKPEEAMLLQAEVQKLSERDELLNSFPVNIGVGTSGEHVKLVQAAFKKLGYFRAPIDGIYGQDLATAILTFQVSKQLVDSENDIAAGYFGIKTRTLLIDILLNKTVTVEELNNNILADAAEKAAEKEKEVLTAEQKKENTTISPLIASMPLSQMELPELKGDAKKSEPTTIAVATASTLPFIRSEKPQSSALKSDPIEFRTPELSQDFVQDVQAKLMTMGYNPGPINGKWNNQSKAALKEFQKKNNLPATGRITASTAKKFDTVLRTTSIEWTMPGESVVKGKSKMLQELQKYLKAKKMYKGRTDGIPEMSFFKALMLFQLK